MPATDLPEHPEGYARLMSFQPLYEKWLVEHEGLPSGFLSMMLWVVLADEGHKLLVLLFLAAGKTLLEGGQG
jgi:hypothetical protein